MHNARSCYVTYEAQHYAENDIFRSRLYRVILHTAQQSVQDVFYSFCFASTVLATGIIETFLLWLLFVLNEPLLLELKCILFMKLGKEKLLQHTSNQKL